MGDVRQSVLDACERLLVARSENDIILEFDRMVESSGVDGFTWTRVDRERRVSIIDRRPPEWQRLYETRGYTFKDAVALQAMRAALPFTWEESVARRGPTDEQRRIFAEAREFGLTDGVMMPVRGARGARAFLGFFSGNSRHFHDLIGRHRRDLHFFALAAGSAYYFLTEQDFGPDIDLTPREQECLLWAAAGKSTPDTAAIMSIGEATVKQHLKSACAKLDAVNRTQATAKAIVLGLISP